MEGEGDKIERKNMRGGIKAYYDVALAWFLLFQVMHFICFFLPSPPTFLLSTLSSVNLFTFASLVPLILPLNYFFFFQLFFHLFLSLFSFPTQCFYLIIFFFFIVYDLLENLFHCYYFTSTCTFLFQKMCLFVFTLDMPVSLFFLSLVLLF